MASQITGISTVCWALFNRLLNENIKARWHWPLWGKSTGQPPFTGGFSKQRASNTETFPFDDIILSFLHGTCGLVTPYCVIDFRYHHDWVRRWLVACRRQTITRSDAELLQIGPWRINLSNILIKIQNFSFKKIDVGKCCLLNDGHLVQASMSWHEFVINCFIAMFGYVFHYTTRL